MWQETRKKDGSGDANVITQKLPNGKQVVAAETGA